MNTRDDPAWTPCIGRCTTTTGDRICKGCDRSVEEIRDWNTYTREQKIAINERLRRSER